MRPKHVTHLSETLAEGLSSYQFLQLNTAWQLKAERTTTAGWKGTKTKHVKLYPVTLKGEHYCFGGRKILVRHSVSWPLIQHPVGEYSSKHQVGLSPMNTRKALNHFGNVVLNMVRDLLFCGALLPNGSVLFVITRLGSIFSQNTLFS